MVEHVPVILKSFRYFCWYLGVRVSWWLSSWDMATEVAAPL
jgi:hypothetical protein